MLGLAIVAFGGLLAMSPTSVAYILGRPSETVSQMINLRASWGGSVMGIGAFVVWLHGLRPYRRAVLGFALWLMAGIGLARVTGFVLDGPPDQRQLVWISAEVAIVLACAIGLRRSSRNV